jgi:pyruvate/2-oxoglutarate dehydrogenase complex dihydrolipoamide dehydrogenase (E3) component
MIYDLAIIGAGSGGLSVAAAAAQFGQSVVLFEKGDMGGECLNSGCIPSKALLAAAKAAHAHRSSASLGIAAHEPEVNFAKVMDHVDGVIAAIAPHDSQARFEGLGVKVVRAAAHFTGRSVLEANGERFEARRIVIATGSRKLVPAIPGLAEVAYFTNETIFKNRTLPGHLIIIGAGPVGLEMAQAFRRLGSQVTVLDAALCLAKDDPELVAVVLERLRGEGIGIHTNASIRSVRGPGANIEVLLDGGQKISGTHLLVAAGRAPNIEGLNLEAAGIERGARGIKIDRSLRSLSNRSVYVAGDAAAGLQLTHVASYHAGLIIRNALFRLPVKNRTDIIPWVTFTDPELAHVGLSEAEARAKHGEKIKVLRWSFSENDRAVAEETPEGLVKIIALKNGRILGASIVGPNAGEQIALWSLAVSRKLKMSAIASLVLPYPTLGEAGKRAAISYFAELPGKPWLRKLIGILKLFG